jgi:hypothetical protein
MPDDHQPPPRQRQPSKPDGDRPSIEIDRTVGGATKQRRFDAPKRTTLTNLPAARLPERSPTLSGLPAPPPLPGELAPTMKAPTNPLEKKTWRLPTPPSALANARRTDPPAAPDTPPTSIRVPADETRATGRPGASLPPPSKSPEAATIEALRRRAEEAEAARAKAERELRVQLESKGPGPYQPPIVTAEPKPGPVTPGDDEPTPGAWRSALFKMVVGLGALLTAAATILGVRANTAIEPKVETNAVRTKVVEVAADTLTDRVTKLEAFARSEAKRRNCVEAQLRDALARGTGHVLTTLPSEPTGWSEQNAPKNEPRLYWKSPTWFTVQGCDAAPSPP